MYEDRAPDSVWLPKRRLRALKPVWEAQHAGPADSEALGSWHCDGLVVRASFDRLRAFDTSTGRQRWVWEVPGRDVLAAMAGQIVDGVALVAHWPDTYDGAKSAGVTALDMRSGHELWSVRQNLDELRGGTSGLRHGTVALSRDRAMVATGEGVVALDSRTGRTAWTVPHGAASRARIGAAGDRLVLVTQWAGSAAVTSVDTTDGTVRWERPVPLDGPIKEVEIASVDPLLLAVQGEGRRGGNHVLHLDADGRTVAEISAADGTSLVPYATWFLADRGRQIMWSGDVLIAFLKAPGFDVVGRLAAFSLSTGRHLWTWDDGWGIDALAWHRGCVVALRHHEEVSEGTHVGWRCDAYVLDPADGRAVARRRLRVTADEPYTVHLHDGRILWIDKKSGRGTPPVKAYDWR
ncbi:PQQ-binding-like beta-propeller repeat protein [Streptomyces sp. YC504]|uniref:PQQ-binding-like beta-propeller repeat protein n=1 Tax=Streptomyces mesophilus TaxID=1775132 RepID=A0A6G4XIV7_9ACTN|nr:PQQ-binding-like beta-propeller repeat protein [Streptomyces mesophilus]NGO77163.1 PQQ-binding-like beta-propeller repeat protein [Streptomyces mesophilus]